MRRLQSTLAFATTIFLITVSVGCSPEADMTDPLIGTWNLNIEESTLPGQPPQSLTRTLEDWGDGWFFVKNDGVNAAGERTGNRIVFRRDGRSYPISTLGAEIYPTIEFTVTSMDPFEVEYRTGNDGEPGNIVGNETFSPDGRIYTVVIRGTNAEGQAFTTTEVWDKQ